MIRRISTLLCLFLIASFASLANNLVIDNVQRLNLSGDRSYVQFDVSWDNSWNVTGKPGNHDAVWVFIKFRECGVTSQWNHALLSTNMGDHTLGSDLAFAQTITTTDRLGNPGSHNTGAMIRRATNGIGDIATQTCTLKVSGSSSGVALDDALEYDVKVIGLEMVQVKQGGFYLGDGDASDRWHPDGNTNGSYHVDTAGALPHLSSLSSYWTDNTTVDADYPNGYEEFYCMKYELSQGAYVTFLNTVGLATYNSLEPHYSSSYSSYYRNAILRNGSGDYYTNRPNRPVNLIVWTDALAYLDWAALRPMTDLEYEKACRGFDVAFPEQKAWGTAAVTEAMTVSAGPETGAETVVGPSGSIANAHYRGSSSSHDGGDVDESFTPSPLWINYGPLGCGIFARSSPINDRLNTGATYWGIMEMAGNLWEFVLPTTDRTGKKSGYTDINFYDGQWGDGQLIESGGYTAHDVPGWPLINSPQPNYTGGLGRMGGSYEDYDSDLEISERSEGDYALDDGRDTSKSSEDDRGIRGVR